MIDFLSTILGWPLIIYILVIGIVCTIACGFPQVRYFWYACRSIFHPIDDDTSISSDMTPLQAFMNTLSTNLGNGSLAGVATAMYAGGPGAAVWIVIIGFLLMSVRFAEVYLSIYFSLHTPHRGTLGGPMLYLRGIMGGRYAAKIYGILCVVFSFLIGNAMQANSIRISLETTWGISPLVTATILTLFVVYVVMGGAKRVVVLSDRIVPLKVITFFSTSFIVLAYNYNLLIPALSLMISSAFSPLALTGGMIGFTVQQAMRFGISRSIFATEAGLGTAAIIFSSTGSTQPVRDGIISMLSVFISTLVCFIIALCIVATGVWDNGMTSTALTIASFETAFGRFSGWIISFLSISFGVGVLVTFVYVTREAWLSVTNGRFLLLFYCMFCCVSFVGAIVEPNTIFDLGEIVNGGMLLINLFGIVCLLPLIRTGLAAFRLKQKIRD